jgi:hypothetical protein
MNYDINLEDHLSFITSLDDCIIDNLTRVWDQSDM